MLAALAVAGLLGACGTSDDRTQARDVVERFYDAVRDDDGAAACAQLSAAAVKQVESQSGQSCSSSITDLDLQGAAIADTHVYITNAKVDLRNGESAFLGVERDGWKLSAVGCQVEEGLPRDRPYDCEVEA